MPSIPINFDQEKIYISNKHREYFRELMIIALKHYPFIQLTTKENAGGCIKLLEAGDGTEWTYIGLPPRIDSNVNLFIMAHEVGHIVCGHVDNYKSGKSPTLQGEIEADEWALYKFKEWGIKINHCIKFSVSMNRSLFESQAGQKN